jgi:hypothetical protein
MAYYALSHARRPHRAGAAARSIIVTCAIAACIVAGCAMTACSGDSPVALKETPGDMLWTLQADVPAVTLAVGGTQQLSATIRRIDGSVASDAPAVKYVSANPLKVQVTSSGLVTGLATTSAPVTIAQSVTRDGVTLVDTTIVSVTATAHPLKTFSVQTVSTRIPQNGTLSIPLTATDSNDAPVTGLAVKYTSLNPGILNPVSGLIYAYTIGSTKFTAFTASYGVTRVDTVDLTVIYPMLTSVICYNKATTGRDFSTTTAVVGVGGTINFNNITGSPLSITFSDPTAVVGGNIVGVGSGITQRTFNTAGTYTFTNQSSGATGTISVRVNN